MTTQGARVRLTGGNGNDGGAASAAHALEGYLAPPAGDKKLGGVVVIQEWHGINDHMKWMCDRFAQAGFLALAPDLFHGRVATTNEQASQMAGALDKKRALAEIGEAVQYLKARLRSGGSGKVAAVGFCMGGALALAAARHVEGLAASVAFYGIPDLPVDELAQTTIPIQAHFGKKDAWAKASAAEAIEAAVRARGGRMDLFVYDAGHAFMRHGDASVYEPKSAALAWERTIDFLRTSLS